MSLLFTRRFSAKYFRRTLLGILLAGLLTLVPVFYWSAFPAMIAEPIVIPLIMREPTQLLKRVTQLIIWPNFTFGPLLLGFIWSFVYGWKTSFRESVRFIVGFSLVLIQRLIIDLEGLPTRSSYWSLFQSDLATWPAYYGAVTPILELS